MAAKLFTAPSDDTKQQHPAKYNYFEERDQLIIGGRQKYMKDDSSVISFYTEALQEVMTKIQRRHARVEGNIWTGKAKIKIVEFCSLYKHEDYNILCFPPKELKATSVHMVHMLCLFT